MKSGDSGHAYSVFTLTEINRVTETEASKIGTLLNRNQVFVSVFDAMWRVLHKIIYFVHCWETVLVSVNRPLMPQICHATVLEIHYIAFHLQPPWIAGWGMGSGNPWVGCVVLQARVSTGNLGIRWQILRSAESVRGLFYIWIYFNQM